METELLKSLIAAGPVALVLLFALMKVWDAYQKSLAEQKDYQERLLKVLHNAIGEGDHEKGKP